MRLEVWRKFQSSSVVLECFFLDGVNLFNTVDVQVQKERQIPAIQKMQKTVEVPQVQYTLTRLSTCQSRSRGKFQ